MDPFVALILMLSQPVHPPVNFYREAIAETQAMDAGDEPMPGCRNKACCTEFDDEESQ